MPTRYRCSGCGNLTRFDVVTTRRTKAFHHFSVGGDLSVEDEEVLDEQAEDVTCRWCGAGRDLIETVSDEMGPPDAAPAEARPTNDGAPTPRAAG